MGRFWFSLSFSVLIVLAIAVVFVLGSGPVEQVDIENTAVLLPNDGVSIFGTSVTVTVTGPVTINNDGITFHDTTFSVAKEPHDANTVNITISTWEENTNMYWSATAPSTQEVWFNITGLSSGSFQVTTDGAITQDNVTGGTVVIHYFFSVPLGQFSIVRHIPPTPPTAAEGFFAVCGLFGGLIFVLVIVLYFSQKMDKLGGAAQGETGEGRGVFGFHLSFGGGGGARTGANANQAKRTPHPTQKATPLEKMMGLDSINFGDMRVKPQDANKHKPAPTKTPKPSGLSAAKMDRMFGLDKIQMDKLQTKPKPGFPSKKQQPTRSPGMSADRLDKLLGLDKIQMDKLKTGATPDKKRPVKAAPKPFFDSARAEKAMGLGNIDFGDMKIKKPPPPKPHHPDLSTMRPPPSEYRPPERKKSKPKPEE